MRSGESSNLKMTEPYKLLQAKKSRNRWNHGKLPGQTNSSEVMDQHLWKEFPEDLLEAVIARLPIASFFRFRSVCRKWNSLLSSHSFSQHCSLVPQVQPWFCTMDHKGLRTYDPTVKKWRRPPVPSLALKAILSPQASAGGLVCFRDVGIQILCLHGYEYLYVCNPLTQTWKELPAIIWNSRYWVVGMALNGESTTTGYKILCVCFDREFKIYDSIINSWTESAKMPANINAARPSPFRSVQAVSVNSSIYFMCPNPEGIASYDTVSGIWNQYLISTPTKLTYHTLAACEGRIMLAGLLTKNATTRLCIWELKKTPLLWEEVDSMGLGFDNIKITCLCNNGLLMLSVWSKQMKRVIGIITYDLPRKKWSKMNARTLSRGREWKWILNATSFYPCLAAVP